MHCPACGTPVASDNIFCHRCGARVRADESSVGGGEPRDIGQRPGLRHPLLPEDDSETTLWEGTFSWKGMALELFWAILATVLLPAICGLVGAEPQVWLWLMMGLGALWLLLGGLLGLRRLNVHYRLTNQRFIHKVGILRRITDRIESIDMDDVHYEQGVIDRLLGSGAITIASSDRTHPAMVLKGIDDVQHVAELMDDSRRRERVRRGLHIESV